MSEVLRSAPRSRPARNCAKTVLHEDVELRKQQLAELYGPIYSYLQLNTEIYKLWMAKKLEGINTEVVDLFQKQNQKVVEILSTKMHLLEGELLPPSFIKYMTSVTIWNIYTENDSLNHVVPSQVAELPEAKYPDQFEEYIRKTTEHLKKELNDLRRKYGIA